MKVFAITVLAILVWLASSASASAELATETVDDIQIPHSLLTDIQMEYQGMAVTTAKKQGNQYILRIDRDTDTSDYQSFNLIYDEYWNQVTKQTMVAPPQPKEEPKKEEPKKEEKKPEAPKPVEQPKPQPEKPQEAPRPPEPKPEPQPEKPPEQEPSE